MSEWKALQLGDHADILSGFPFPSEGFSQEEGVPLIRIRDLLAGKVETYFIGPYPDEFVIDDGDILIGMDGDFNIVRWTKGMALLNQRICKVFTSTPELDDGYLFWLLGPELQDIHQKTPQTTVKHLSVRDLNRLSIEVPQVNEQKLIARILDTLDFQIQKTEALIAKLEKVKEGLLHDLLTRGIDENGQLRPSPEQASELYKESQLGLIPKQWSSMTVGEALENKIILSIQDGNHGEVHPKNSEFTASGYPFVMANDIRENEIDFENCHKIPQSIKNRLRIGFSKKGDVLLSHKGTIGNCAMVPREAGCVILTPQVTYYRCNESSLRPEYLLSFFKTHIFQSPLYRLSGQTTRSYLGITGQKALSLLMPPIEEQDLIKNTISQIGQEVKGERKHLVKLKTQKDGLMDDLLTGRVRVTALLDQAQAITQA